MRRARDGKILRDEQNRVIALNLGADHCAEHEWGIKKLNADFGISDDENLFGIERRRITQIPEFVVLEERKSETVLMAYRYFKEYCKNGKLPNELYIHQRKDFDPKTKKFIKVGEPEMGCAWDEGSFGVVASAKEDREALREIYAALQTKDLAIWLGGGGVFQNAGLVLGIISRVSEESKNTMHMADENRFKLKKAAEETGIAKELEKAGKHWFALSPYWAHEEEKAETAYPVVFWLNPMQQNQHNYGRFTVEKLREWAKDRGPVMKCKT